MGRARETFEGKLTENHGRRLGCSVNILVSLKEQASSVEKKVFSDKTGDRQESTHNFFQVSDFLWFYVMLLYLSIYFDLFSKLFGSGLEKGIFLGNIDV